MFLSIIIPTYNAEKYIADCLDSCLKQDIPYDDYEIICTDDGSSDKTPEIIQQYAEKYPNIRAIIKEHGKAGRTLGLKLAQGDYVWFVDNDDLIEENILLMFRNMVSKSDCDRLTFPCYIFTEEFTEEENRLKDDKALEPYFAYEDSVVWTSIIKRSFLLDNEIYPYSKRFENRPVNFCGDTFFIYECNKSEPKTVRLTERPLYFYRLNNNSQTSTQSRESQLTRYRSFKNMSLILMEDYNEAIASDKNATVSADLFVIMLRRCLEIVAKQERSDYKSMLKELKKEKLFPAKIPKECSYTLKSFVTEKNGKSMVNNFFRYYSVNPFGLYMISLPHRVQRVKIKLSRRLRSNPLMNFVLNLKNKLLGR